MTISKLVQALQQPDALTHNGALTNETSGSETLDLFFLAGACRGISEEQIEAVIARSWNQNPTQTLKVIFWAGDIREAAGERKFFQTALGWLEKEHPQVLIQLLEYVPVFSRWDSLFNLGLSNAEVQLNVISIIEKVIHNHPTPILNEELIKTKSLLAKWMPRKQQYNNFASRYRKATLIGHKSYRQQIVELSNTVEQKLCSKNFSTIDYETVPSVAMNKYRSTFTKHDAARYAQYIDDVSKGEKKINAGAIFPHDLFKAYENAGRDATQAYKDSINVQWNNLPNYLAGQEDSIRILPVCDTSGSMTAALDGLPYAISISLGIYLSERNKSAFKDAFITFSQKPQLQYLEGTFTSKVKQFVREDVSNTDFQAVFDLILRKAKREELKDEDLPTHIVVVSDMEFDQAKSSSLTNFEEIKLKFSESGYTLPNLVFWNCNGRSGNIPVTVRDNNVCLISGASPSIIRSVLTANISPEGIMTQTLNSSRYAFLDAIQLEELSA